MKERISKQKALQVKPGSDWWVRVHGGSVARETISLKFAMPAGVGCMKHPVLAGNVAGA
jgi:hypothetical protein